MTAPYASTEKTHKHLLEVHDLHVSLGTAAARVDILKGAQFHINRADAVSIVGPSGSGKSTLLMSLAGLERPTSGNIVIDETDITALSENDLAQFRGRHIGVVFQSFHLIPTMTALENVAVPLELSGADDAFDRAKAELENVGLGHRLSHYPAQMSGGEQQRVGIARALAPRPQLLIADEPTGNLDAKMGSDVADLMFAANKDRDMTLVLVTHDQKLAERANTLLTVKEGLVTPLSA